MSLVSYLASGWSARLSPSLSPVTAIQTAISPTLSPSYNSQVMQNVSEDQDSRDPQHTRSQAAHFPQQRHSSWAQTAQEPTIVNTLHLVFRKATWREWMMSLQEFYDLLQWKN